MGTVSDGPAARANRRQWRGGWICPLVVGASCLLALLAAGCAESEPTPPASLDQLHEQLVTRPNAFPEKIIVLHNLSRALDTALSESERTDSLEVFARLAGDDPAYHEQLASVLPDPKSPNRLRLAVLQMLARADYPGLGPYVAKALPVSDNRALRQALLDWLTRHPTPEIMAEVVRLWAADNPADKLAEQRYRRVVETMVGRTWPDALLEGLNKPTYFARGSAIELLSTRLPQAELRERIGALEARTAAVRALQYYAKRLNYIPARRSELFAAVVIFVNHRSRLDAAAKLADRWAGDHGDPFRICDFHLLSCLAADEDAKLATPADLTAGMADGIAKRRNDPGAAGEIRRQLEALYAADVVRLYLIAAMLQDPAVSAAVGQIARRDRKLTSSSLGGLIFQKSGEATPRLYAPETVGDDKAYVPSKRMAQDAIDSLAYFHGHFWQIENAKAIGPGDKDADVAAKLAVPGVVLTNLDAERFNATFYDRDGVRIDLGGFAFMP